MTTLPYNKFSKESICEYADKLVGMSFKEILDNDYMVCVGYATLLEELVDRLNDKNVIEWKIKWWKNVRKFRFKQIKTIRKRTRTKKNIFFFITIINSFNITI